jgi:predicted methyltransferase
MRKALTLVAAVCVLAGPVCADSGGVNAQIAAAVASPDRPASDSSRDALRKPADMLAFSGIKPGDVVADLIPGQGYFTRLFSKLAGPRGKVFAVVPAEFLSKRPTGADSVKAIAAQPAFANVIVVATPAASLAVPQAVDVAWTSQNYHDLYGFYGADQAAAFDRAVFAMLRPGGTFIVVDHSGLAGSSATAPTTLHRIDEATVKAQVLAAGFVLTGTSDVLRNPADPRTAAVFTPEIRGHTDQFMLKFRKPG